MTLSLHPASRRTVLTGAALGSAAVASTAVTGPATRAAAASARRRRPGDRPNVVVVSVDDLGWDEMGCYGNDFNETPEIDRLAAEGTRFTQAYAAAPLCSPTRAALVTGRYPGRVGITDFLRPQTAASDAFLDPQRTTSVAEVLDRRGYTSGLIGKWHLTETYSGPYRDRPGNPYAHGFDDVRVTEELYIGGGDYTHPYFFMPSLPAREPGEYLTDRLAAEVEDFVATHRDEPFFLHVSNYAVHTELVARAELLAKYEAKPGADRAPNRPLLAAMLESVDTQVGRIRRALEANGLEGNTLLLVTSDNGGQSRPANAPLRGGKGELYEGGIRVPLVAWGPGLVRAGLDADHLTSTIDLLPTAAELAGVPVPPGVDGVSVVPTLTGRGRQRARPATYWAYPHFIGGTRPHAAVREGDLKLVMFLRDRRCELYDLAADPSETTDLAARRGDDTARLRRLLEAHLAELDLHPGPPDAGRVRREVTGTFDAGLERYTLAPVPSGGAVADATVEEGRLRISAGGAAHLLAVGEQGPRGSEFVVELDPGPLPPAARERTLFAGIARGGDDYLLLRYRHDLRRVGWDLRVGGRLETGGAEPTTVLDGSVDLADDASRIALAVRGAQAAAYADLGRGWEFLFRLDVAGALDLRDDAVRRGFRYAVGGRVNGSAVSVDGFRAWER
ncbi:sulfatase [Nocardioides sp. CFH 31398]|uniref:sulfatase n=1 Tax=Nocardioides sp. CFH 31398 TaxID=2919579 RepID=UPI001F051CF1|nr:sulfatase [Nocardioides sp. CFH 31398]MCH1865778.1 sulfatase [Nocardioides sp. CFH 31398]